jgi:hypothetical protein
VLSFPQNVVLMREGTALASRRVLPVALVALALLSCNLLPSAAPQAPSGPVGEVAREIATQVAAIAAPNAELADQPFEDLLAKLDLANSHGASADEIVGQIRKTRAAVAARAAASAFARPRLASLPALVGTFSIPHFASRFAFSLDDLTKKNQTIALPSSPYSHMETGATSFTTTTLNVTEMFTGEGSKVTATVRWSYSTITIETRTGATLVHVTDDRELVGTMDVCPDAGGSVPGTVKVTSNIAAKQGAVMTTRRSNGNSTFKGTVNEQATLQSVRQEQRVETSWQSTSGDGGYNADNTATWNAGANGYLGGLATGSITSDLTPSGGASAAEAARAAGWDIALDAFAIESAYQKAQDLWRRGRCVIVAAPDYDAETPISAEQQNAPQHDEAVEPSSETKFSVNLKHRFSGSVSAPITAALSSGQKTIGPSRLESSGSLTYKAPDEEDKRATAKLQSTSKRGIGTLVLDFHTGGGLTLSITGEVHGNSTTIVGTVRVLDTVRIGPLEFKKSFGDFWEGTGTWTAETSSFTTAGLGNDTCTGRDSGKITMMATRETRGDRTVWVIDPLDGSTEGTGSMECVHSQGDQTLRGVTIPARRTHESEGDAAQLFIGNLSPFTIPAEGGTVRVHGSQSAAGGSWTSEGTAVAPRR